MAFLLCAPLASASGADEPLTCRRDVLDPESYRLTTQAQAVMADPAAMLREHVTPRTAAERALAIDPRNLMGQSILARELLIAREAPAAEAAWARVMGAGGAVGWTGTLYDVDVRTYFVLLFDAHAFRIYRFDRVAGPVKRRLGGIPDFPGGDNERFWAALGGCIDAAIRPEAEIPWSNVRGIKAGNWVLWFELAQKVSISSDRTGKARSLDEIKVNLHGVAGEDEEYQPLHADEPITRYRGPAWFQDLFRRTLARFVDPEKRIALPPAPKPGLGW